MSADAPAALATVTLTADDCAALVALEAAHGWPTGGSQVPLSAQLDDAACGMIGLRAGEMLLGYAALVRQPFDAELQALLIDEGWRGRGLAGRLLDAVVGRARGWGSERLLLEVRAGNAVAIALYRRAGFREDGRRRGYYPPLCGLQAPREDALLMSLPLAVGASASG